MPYHDCPGVVRILILDPIHRHVGHDGCVVPLNNSPIFSVEIEFGVKVLPLTFVSNEMMKAGTGHVIVFAHVPLADSGSVIPGFLHSVAQCQFAVGEADRLRPKVWSAPWIGFETEALLVAPGEQAGARGRAIRTGDVTVRASHARGRQRIEVGRRDILAAVEPDVGVAQVIADDEQDVGAVGSQRSECAK